MKLERTSVEGQGSTMISNHKHSKLHIQTTGTTAPCICILWILLYDNLCRGESKAGCGQRRGAQAQLLALPTVHGSPQNRTFNFKLPRLCGTIDSQHKIRKALLWAQRERQEWCHKPMFCSQWRREIILIPSIPLSMPTTDLADATFVQVQSLFGSKQGRATKETLSIHPGSSKRCAHSCPRAPVSQVILHFTSSHSVQNN